MTFPKLGNLAPTFSLPNQRGETVALKDFCERKAVVLYFYPKAMTPGCTVQACGLRDTGAEYAARSATLAHAHAGHRRPWSDLKLHRARHQCRNHHRHL